MTSKSIHSIRKKTWRLWFNAAGLLAILYLGWSIRDEYLIRADAGLGYALGITGGTCMLVLLLYPLRKHFNQTRLLVFSTRNWFRIHMSLGLIGPILILYHCNFRLGSTNSNVALLSMSLMVTSGLFGRYIYSKVHSNVYGVRLELKQILDYRLQARSEFLASDTHGVEVNSKVVEILRAIEDRLMSTQGVLHRLGSMIGMWFVTRQTYRAVVHELRHSQAGNQAFQALSAREQKKCLKAANKEVAIYLAQIRKLASLGFFDRLFSYWHMLHMPIFLMLIVTGLFHVYAVHTY